MRSLYLLVPLLLVAGGVVLTWQGLQPPSAETVAAAERQPRYAVTDAEWTRLGPGGQPEFRATANSIQYYEDESVQMQDVVLDSMGGKHSPWHVTADHGRAPPRERRLLLTGNVAAEGRYTGTLPVTFTTDRLWVDLLRRELRSDAEVSVASDLRKAAGRGMRADFNGERVEILNDVRVEYVPD